MAARRVAAADSGVISRWGEPRSSKFTMNFRTAAEAFDAGYFLFGSSRSSVLPGQR
jgi:hypothetical protein